MQTLWIVSAAVSNRNEYHLSQDRDASVLIVLKVSTHSNVVRQMVMLLLSSSPFQPAGEFCCFILWEERFHFTMFVGAALGTKTAPFCNSIVLKLTCYPFLSAEAAQAETFFVCLWKALSTILYFSGFLCIFGLYWDQLVLVSVNFYFF